MQCRSSVLETNPTLKDWKFARSPISWPFSENPSPRISRIFTDINLLYVRKSGEYRTRMRAYLVYNVKYFSYYVFSWNKSGHFPEVKFFMWESWGEPNIQKTVLQVDTLVLYLRLTWGFKIPGFIAVLKVHKIEIFFASILKFVIFLCQLCQNIKILGKHFFDWTILGGATIIPRSLKTTRNEKNFQDRPKIFYFLNHIWPFNIC